MNYQTLHLIISRLGDSLHNKKLLNGGFIRKKDEITILLAEYQQAQSSGEHHTSTSWTAAGVTWTATLALLSVASKQFDKGIGAIDHPVSLLGLSIVGMLILVFDFFLNKRLAAVIVQKYSRCKEIERYLGMRLHRDHPRNYSSIVHIFYTVLPLLFFLSWMGIVGLCVFSFIKDKL